MRMVQIGAVLLQRARQVPPLRYARVVLPHVEEGQVLRILAVEGHHAESLAQVRDPTAVDDGARPGLDGPARVPS